LPQKNITGNPIVGVSALRVLIYNVPKEIVTQNARGVNLGVESTSPVDNAVKHGEGGVCHKAIFLSGKSVVNVRKNRGGDTAETSLIKINRRKRKPDRSSLTVSG